MSIDVLTTFLGWCLVFNICILLLFLLIATVFKDGLARINAKLFGVSEQDTKDTMFSLFYQYRLLFAFFNVRGGQKLLINGAGGGVGTLGVQIAKAMGIEHVTSVDSAGKLDLLRLVGYDHTIDYKKMASSKTSSVVT